jgi:hypothetical protein
METTIKQWVEDPKRSYSVGVALLDKHCTNRYLVRYFQNTVERFGMKKLTYELKKLALKVNEPEPLEPPQTPTVVDTPPTDEGGTTQIADTPPSDSEKPPIPEVAAIAKGIVHDTWVELSRIKEEMFNLGTENTPDIVSRRKVLLDEQAPLMARYNEVYEAKEAFFNGEMDEQQLLAVINQEEPKVEEKRPVDNVDLSKMSDLDLAKAIKAAKATITRCNNQLRFQQDVSVKDNKPLPENPMPDCPKKEKIVKKLADKTQQLVILTAELESRGNS